MTKVVDGLGVEVAIRQVESQANFIVSFQYAFNYFDVVLGSFEKATTLYK